MGVFSGHESEAFERSHPKYEYVHHRPQRRRPLQIVTRQRQKNYMGTNSYVRTYVYVLRST